MKSISIRDYSPITLGLSKGYHQVSVNIVLTRFNTLLTRSQHGVNLNDRIFLIFNIIFKGF